jgi:hypothetical protein
MKKLSILVALLMMVLFCFPQDAPEDCNKFKTGKFAYVNDSSETVIIRRTLKRQEERNQKTNTVTKFKIRWTSICGYELTQTWSNSRAGRKFNRGVRRVQITRVNDQGYDYSCACKDKNEAARNSGTIRKIE